MPSVKSQCLQTPLRNRMTYADSPPPILLKLVSLQNIVFRIMYRAISLIRTSFCMFMRITQSTIVFITKTKQQHLVHNLRLHTTRQQHPTVLFTWGPSRHVC